MSLVRVYGSFHDYLVGLMANFKEFTFLTVCCLAGYSVSGNDGVFSRTH